MQLLSSVYYIGSKIFCKLYGKLCIRSLNYMIFDMPLTENIQSSEIFTYQKHLLSNNFPASVILSCKNPSPFCNPSY